MLAHVRAGVLQGGDERLEHARVAHLDERRHRRLAHVLVGVLQRFHQRVDRAGVERASLPRVIVLVLVLALVFGLALVLARHAAGDSTGHARGNPAGDALHDSRYRVTDAGPDGAANRRADAGADATPCARGDTALDSALDGTLDRSLDRPLQLSLDDILVLRVAPVVRFRLTGIRLDRLLELLRILNLRPLLRRELGFRGLDRRTLLGPWLDRCDRHDQDREHHGRRHSARPGQAAARHARVENRHQPSFELRALRHRQARPGQHGGEAARAHHTGDVEELVRVVRPARAGGEHEVVAGALTLGAQPPRRHPRERVEPVRRAGDLRDQVRQAIAALHVRELVQEDDAEAVGRPRIRVSRHQHRRTEDPPRHRHRRRAGAQEANAREPEAIRERVRLREPRRIGHDGRAARHPEHCREAEEHPPENHGGAGDPREQRDRAPRDRCAAGRGDLRRCVCRRAGTRGRGPRSGLVASALRRKGSRRRCAITST